MQLCFPCVNIKFNLYSSTKSKIKIVHFYLPSAVRASRQTAEPTVLSPRFVLRQANARTTKGELPSGYLL